MKSILYARPRTFGFHTFRRTLASVLVRMKVDIKTVQEILGHQNLKTTLQVYAKAMSEDKLEAQGMFLEELWISWRGRSVRTIRETRNL
jgi:integrase